MMRTHGGAWTVVLVLGASVALGTVPDARAELDYEFAKGLLDWQDNNNFHSTDLVERLIAKLAKSPNKDQQLEAKLILAKLKRRQAESASAEKRNALLTEADNLYKEFLKDGAKHRLAKECDAEQATIQKDYALALIKAAQENPALNKENRAKAVDIYKKIADLMEADKAQFREPLKKALADLDKWQNDNPDAENLPPHLIAPAQKALEGFVIRDKKYVIARLEQVEAYPEGEEQKMAARALIKYCDELVGSEDIGMIDTVCMWYHFIKGRLHALILEEKEATEAWRSALEVQPDNPDPDVKRTVLDVRKLIYGDLVKMKMRGAEKNPEKYNEIIDIVGSALYEPSMKSYWEQPHGKLLLMDYAFALIRQPEASANEYEQAIKQLRKIVEGGPPWSNNASRTMAQIIREGRSKKPPIRPRLTAEQWFDIARGFFIEGQLEYKKYEENKDGDAKRAQESFDSAWEKYNNAVEYYRRAIGQARNPVLTPVPTRMKVEPQAWFEMGLSYYKMDHYYESIIAYQALRTIFAKDFRAHWMPDPQKNKELYKNKELTAALAELDKVDENDVRNDGLLHKTEKNIVIALTKNAQTPTRFNKKLKVDIMRSEEFSVPGGVNDTDYQAGKLLMDEARDLQEQGNRFEKAKNNKEAEKQFTQALAKLEEGAKNFAKVQVASKAYEVGLYQAASCYTLAQQILASEKIRAAMKPEEIEAKLKELTELSLGLYKKYEDHVAKEPDNTEEGIERRKKLARGVLLSRTTLHYGAKDWDNVIKSCDEYMEYEKANPSGEGDAKLLTVVFNKFRALSNLAGDKNPPECDAYLEAASKLVPQLKEKDSFYIYALQNISQRYHNALAKAEKARLDQAVIDGYDANIAKYQTAALELKDPNERTLQEWGNLLYYNEKEGKKREACDIAVEMLKRFDPQNRNKQIGDEDEKKEKDIWDTYMTGIKDVIAKGYSSDRTKAFNCLKDHEVLIDYMYDTREGVNNEDVDKRPKHDKYNIDYEKALKQIKTIKQNYPDCPTHKPTHETHYVNGKSYLAMIEDEIEYRRRIIAVRDLLSELALKVGVDFEKAGDQDSAKKYRSIADEQLTVLEEVYGDVPEMKVKSANIKVANGDFQGALDILYALKNKETDTSSARYIDVSKRISEIHFQKGEYNDAADYPKFIAATAGMESNWVKKNWPDMKAFLDKCYDKGVKPLEVVQSKPSDLPVDYRPKSPDETEFEQLKMVFDLAERTPAMSNQLLTPEFLQKYNLLKGKIEHFSEFQKLERLLLTHRGKADEKEIITDAFMARYNAIDELVKVERDAWRAYQKFDQAITEYGGPDKVPDEIKNARANGLTKSKELSEKLKSVPEVKLDDKPKDAKTEPAPETKTETKTEPADAAKTE